MNSLPFQYYQPQSVEEAVSLYHELDLQGKKVMYYGGGTEIITFRRIDPFYTDAVINISAIEECNDLTTREGKYILGAAISLTQAVFQDHFLLLRKTAKEIADQTARNKISLGGNICSHIRFKEAILPFLVTDCMVKVATHGGVQLKSLKEAFNEEYQLPVGTLLIQLLVDEKKINVPFYANKIRTIGTVGYPVISINAVKIDGKLKIAVSGASSLPVQSEMIDYVLNESQISYPERIKKALQQWPMPIIDDIQGSASYKRFLLERTFLEMFNELEVE